MSARPFITCSRHKLQVRVKQADIFVIRQQYGAVSQLIDDVKPDTCRETSDDECSTAVHRSDLSSTVEPDLIAAEMLAFSSNSRNQNDSDIPVKSPRFPPPPL